MANVIQLKRGDEAQRTGFTPAAGEPIFVVDENKMYIGDGSTAVQSLSALGGDITIANGSNNRVMTATGSSGINGEANLTFDGSTLAVTGDATVSDDLGLVSDGALLTFGGNSEVKLTHVHDVGLTLTHTATGDGTPVVFQLKSEEDAIIADEVIASLEFAAGDSGGTDGATVAAGIHAIAEGTFAADANATKLVFTTGVSETAASSATAKMTLSSAGLLTLADDLVLKNSATIGAANDTDLLTLGSALLTVAGEVQMTTLDIGGTNVTSTAAELNILDGVTATATELNLIDGVTATTAELNYVDGVTSAIQTQIDSKGATAGSSSVVTTGALNSGSITSGFGTIDTGASNITTTGVGAFGSLDISGAIDVDGVTNLDNTDIDGTFTMDGTAFDVNATTTLALDNTNTTNGVSINTATADSPITIGNATSETTVSDNLTVSGNLTVTGNTTVVDILAGAVGNTIEFEGSGADGNETTLGVINPNADRTINLPNQDGTLGVFAAASTTQISSTPEELNVLDGITAVVGELNMLDIGTTAVGSAVASKVVAYDANLDFTGGRNITISGELDAATLDISGNMDLEGDIDVNGTSNLDAVDIDGALQIDAAFTSGVDGQGYDTKFFGDTASAYMLWDTSADDLILGGAARVVVPASGLVIGSTAMTSTAAELNFNDGVTLGTAIASKTVTTDANIDSTGMRNLTISGELDAATLDISGNMDLEGDIDVNGTSNLDAVDIDGALQIDAAFTSGVDGQGYDTKFFGDTASAYMLWDTSADDLILGGAARVVVPASGLVIGSTAVTSTAAELNVLDGITAVVGELNALDIGATAVGTAVASKAVILDSNKDYTGIRNLTITGALDGATIAGGTF